LLGPPVCAGVRPLPLCEQFFDGETDVPRDLAQKGRGYVTPRVKRHGRAAAIRMAVLPVRTALASEGEAVAFQQPLDLAGLQNGDRAQELGDLDRMGADELRLEPRLSVLQQERNDFLKVSQELVDRSALRMGAWPARDVADEEACIGISLDDCSEGAHGQ
jgi:hypothetical protein